VARAAKRVSRPGLVRARPDGTHKLVLARPEGTPITKESTLAGLEFEALAEGNGNLQPRCGPLRSELGERCSSMPVGFGQNFADIKTVCSPKTLPAIKTLCSSKGPPRARATQAEYVLSYQRGAPVLKPLKKRKSRARHQPSQEAQITYVLLFSGTIKL